MAVLGVHTFIPDEIDCTCMNIRKKKTNLNLIPQCFYGSERFYRGGNYFASDGKII